MYNIDFPVLDVKLVDINKIKENGYNPNKVAPPELNLLELSIREDGYTQPIVCYYDKKKDLYTIIDGFHRYYLAKEKFKLPKIPVTVINKNYDSRIASTIRHNRARGKHSIQGMSNIIEIFLSLGWEEKEIAKCLGMDMEEVIRLKQTTGLKRLFVDYEFSKSWNEFEKKHYLEKDDLNSHR
ncbi:ParB/RepB/Spo0J family partition protein [Enterococcus hirae]|nr:ParB/RepB/Spo0J family partition protein [Enterococcus hirae]MCH1976498.1 ParB/RepB/Spo0J family partition protein [Enterococcus hirae]MCH1976503.1 ParB/RepB/Spo0J family partition protein [Enterococcus hirae]